MRMYWGKHTPVTRKQSKSISYYMRKSKPTELGTTSVVSMQPSSEEHLPRAKRSMAQETADYTGCKIRHLSFRGRPV